MTGEIKIRPINRNTGQPVMGSLKPTEINLKMDIRQFTSAFDFRVDVAESESLNLRSHDFVEFYTDVPLSRLPNGQFVTTEHQLGVGVLESITKTTSDSSFSVKANGRDLFSQLMLVPFKKRVEFEELSLVQFIDRMLQDTYIREYNQLRGSGQDIVDKGSTALNMIFVSDLQQTKAQMLKQYADFAINLVYQNRLGQVEVVGRPDTLGSTSVSLFSLPAGELIKGSTRSVVRNLLVSQNFSQVVSEYTVLHAEGEAKLDRNEVPSETVINDDSRVVNHIKHPNYEVFSTSDLNTFAGNINLKQRMNDIARHRVRTSNAGLNSVVVQTDKPFSLSPAGVGFPFKQGDVWKITSNEKEFTAPNAPNGTDSVNMALVAIDYSQSTESLDVQLEFQEPDTLL